MALSQIVAALVLLGVCFVGFGALARRFACNPDHPVFFSRSIGLDLAYCLLGVVYAGAGPALLAAGATLNLPLGAPSLTGRTLSALPVGLQLIALLVATDFCQYWLHRAFHGRRLWPFHAVHHGAREVNWTTTFRVHPVNYLAVSAASALGARLVGFSDPTLLLAAPIFFFSGALTHANLDWTFGPLRYVVASPVFHRWHHDAAPEHRERNFAPMFPVWDLMFGTFDMPSAGAPGPYGASGAPPGLLGQLVEPFRASLRSRA